MTTSPLSTVPVTSDAELTERWTQLVPLAGPPARRSLHLTWLRRDGTAVPLVLPIDDLPVEVDRDMLGNLALVHAGIAEAEGRLPSELHLALCLKRRGPAGLSPDDHAWVAAIESVVRGGAGLDCSLHVSNGGAAVAVLPRERWSVG